MYRVFKNILTMIIVLAGFCSESSLLAATNNQEDPCQQITGSWKGEWNNTSSGCRWNMMLDGVAYKENVQFVMRNSGTKECGGDYTATITGVCVDGMLTLLYHNFASSREEHKMTGRVFGKILTLEDSRKIRNAFAYKQS